MLEQDLQTGNSKSHQGPEETLWSNQRGPLNTLCMSTSQILFGLVLVESAASFAEARSEVYKKWKVWSTQMRVAGGW